MTDSELLEKLIIGQEALSRGQEETNIRLNRLEQKVDILDTKVNNLEQKVDIIDLKVNNLEQKVDIIDLKVNNLEQKVDIIDLKVDSVKDQLEDMEVKNANRHLLINERIDILSRDVMAIETITAKNWNDLTNLRNARY